jgi:hypothetical protein
VKTDSINDFTKIYYLQDSFKHSGFKHLNILSSSGIIVAKLQNGQLTRSGIPACFISSSCNRRSNIENIHWHCFTDNLEEKEKLIQLRRQEAKDNGEIFECGCCFDDECFFEEMSVCADGHLFCKECIRRSSEVVIGDSKTKFPCLLDTQTTNHVSRKI